MKRIDIDWEFLPIDYRDAGPWRGYHLTATGDTEEEAEKDATISEVDQDGGEMVTYPLSMCRNDEVAKAAKERIAGHEEHDPSYV